MRVAILTISDSSSRGERPDSSGPAVRERCVQMGWQITGEEVLPDDQKLIADRLRALANSGEVDLILTQPARCDPRSHRGNL
jgi:molybdopterin adenylyltransferase